jgi:hypothetical protein
MVLSTRTPDSDNFLESDLKILMDMLSVRFESEKEFKNQRSLAAVAPAPSIGRPHNRRSAGVR